MSHCKTCCCNHAGRFPRFALYYADGSVHGGGGPEDTDLVVYALPRSWVTAPPLGVLIGVSENTENGRDWHRGGEQYYAVPHGARGGPAITASGPETRLVPFVSGKLGLVKLGEFMHTADYHRAMRAAMDDGYVPAAPPNTPFDLEMQKD